MLETTCLKREKNGVCEQASSVFLCAICVNEQSLNLTMFICFNLTGIWIWIWKRWCVCWGGKLCTRWDTSLFSLRQFLIGRLNFYEALEIASIAESWWSINIDEGIIIHLFKKNPQEVIKLVARNWGRGRGIYQMLNVAFCATLLFWILNDNLPKKKKKDGRKIYEKQNFCSCGLLLDGHFLTNV